MDTKKKFETERRANAVDSIKDQDTLLAAATARIIQKIKAAREDPCVFIEFVMRDPQGNCLVLKDWQREVINSFRYNSKSIVQAARNHGKCCDGSERVLLADGRNVRIDSIKEPTNVMAYNTVNHKYEACRATVAINGVKPVRTIQVSTGRELTVTDEHPFLTWDGWRDAKDLKPGDFVALAHGIENLGTKPLAKDDAWLLGLLIGDGSLSGSSPIVTTADVSVVESLRQICTARSWLLNNTGSTNSGKASSYRIVRDQTTNANPPCDYIHKDLCVPVATAYNKRIPTCVFTAPDIDIAEFLAGYLDSDATVSAERNGSVTYWSVAKDLLKDAQHLLARLGIQSYLTKKNGQYKNLPHVSWRLVVCGYENLQKFRDKIHPRGERRLALESLDLTPTKVCKGDLIPSEWRKDLTLSPSAIKYQHGISINNKYATNRAKAIAAATADQNTQLVSKLKAPVFWVKVENIAVLGARQTYAIEVEKLHNYINEDFITHNTTLVVGYCLWVIGNNPNIRIKFFSQNDKRAKERLFEIKSNIENNQAFKLVFPDIKPSLKGEWSKSAIMVDRQADLKDATVEALGIETSATGGRCDVIVLDDVCDLRSSVVYPTLRDKIIMKFMGELLPMLDPGGKVIAIATPWAHTDLTAVLAKNSEFKSLFFAVGNDKDPYAPLWPERWPRDELLKLRATQGPIEFDRAYRCIAYSGDAIPCKPEWIKFYNKDMLGDPHKLICVQAYDLAIGEKENADYFAGVTVLYNQERNIAFVADAFHAHLSFSSQAQKIVDQYIRWSPDRVIIERVGLGGGLENFLREKSPITLPLVAYKPRGDKQRRFMEASPWLEDGHVYFHPNLDPQRNVLLSDDGDIITELLEFPIGRHDDYVDALVEAIWGLEEFKLQTMDEGWMDGGSLRARMTTVG